MPSPSRSTWHLWCRSLNEFPLQALQELYAHSDYCLADRQPKETASQRDVHYSEFGLLDRVCLARHLSHPTLWSSVTSPMPSAQTAFLRERRTPLGHPHNAQ